MAFKINLSTKDGKTYKLEAEAPGLMNKSLGDTIQGAEVSPDLAGYELEITGTSDKSGLTSLKEVEGIGLKKVLLGYGKAMNRRPKGDKKKLNKTPGGLRLRKTVRGKVISEAISQINIKVLKEGGKKLSEVFPDQNKAPEAPAQEQSEKPAEEAQPAADQEPKESEKSIEEKANPDEEPKK